MNLLEKTLQRITPQDAVWRQKATERLEQLTMPHWALGRLMDLAVDLAGITQSLHPPVTKKAVVTMVGDHGVVAEGVSKYPQEVTPQMVHNFVNGGAAINALANQVGAKVFVVDMGVNADLDGLAEEGKIISGKVAFGTGNIAKEAAMSREQAIASIETGIKIVEEFDDKIDVFGTGDMGIGNTTPSTAIVACLTGVDVEELTGRGTGLDDMQLQHKINIVRQALNVNKPDRRDGLDVLTKVGGFEIGGIAGIILGAAASKKPVIIDGLISTAGALVAHSLAPDVREYIIASHRSVEQGHKHMHEYLGCEPLLDLGLRLGEGTGAALVMNLVDAAVRILTEIATFEEAAVSGEDK